MTQGRQGVPAAPMQGLRFGALICVNERHHKNEYNNWFGLFHCDCGSACEKRLADVRRAKFPSCGCKTPALNGDASRKHGKHATKVYRTWQRMKVRCFNENRDTYPDYGGRGITVCSRWLVFEQFYEDMGDPPSTRHSIDRINVDGDYEPGNCRWATTEEQCRNKRNNCRILWSGREHTVVELSEQYGIADGTLRARLRRGWSVLDALLTPVGRK